MDHDTDPGADPQALRDAPQVSLLRRPATEAAQALTERVAGIIQRHSARSRKIGPKGRPKLLGDVGLVLGGLLSRSPERPFVRAQRDHGAAFWKPPVAIGGKAFWEKIKPLADAGLVKVAPSINVPNGFGGFTGKATRIAATDDLWALAAEHGCTLDTRPDDWPIDRTIVTKRAKVPVTELVKLWEWPYVTRGQVKHKQNRHSVQTPPYAKHLIAAVERLNEVAAGLRIEGCSPLSSPHRVVRVDS